MDEEKKKLEEMANIAQVGWWEADLNAHQYECSSVICNLLELKDTRFISFKDFREPSPSLLQKVKYGSIPAIVAERLVLVQTTVIKCLELSSAWNLPKKRAI